MGLMEKIVPPALSRRRFLQATAASGAAASLVGGQTLQPTQAQPAAAAQGSQTTITKNICHQCPARCGIDVYTTDGRVHAIYGNTDHPIASCVSFFL